MDFSCYLFQFLIRMIQKLVNASLIASLVLSSALPVMAAQKGKGNSDDKKMTKKTLDIACMANAVDKRESSIMSGFDVFATATKNAYQARKDALKAAWGNTDPKARNKAIKEAWETYRKAAMKARKDWGSARHAAWMQFAKDSKACRGTGSGQDTVMETEAADNDGK